MSITFENQHDNVIELRVSAELKLAEFQDAQSRIEKVIEASGKVSILIITEDFQGWERTEGWEDFSFQEKNDSFINKIAILGEPKWKDLILTFAAKGLRPVAIEYFDVKQEANARAWLKHSS